ncbi:MAG: CHAT domain-containing protein [Coleofasciculaceae cyanobacterium SM2_1_6]|nr:CHAT domain-containing protein [Coleofasciculaceae cyanobacterium SM2_1_6]
MRLRVSIATLLLLSGIGGVIPDARASSALTINYQNIYPPIHPRHNLGDDFRLGLASGGAGLMSTDDFAKRAENFPEPLPPRLLAQFVQSSPPVSSDNSTASSSEQELERLYQLADQQSSNNQHREAIETFTQMLNLARQVANREAEGLALLGIGFQQNILGDRSAALESYQQALGITQELNDRPGQFLLLTNIAEIYRDTGEPDRALALHQEVLTGRRELLNQEPEARQRHQASIARTLNNLGATYNDLGQRRPALDYFQQALTIQQELGNRRSEAIILNNLGNTHRALGQLEEALQFFSQALVVRREVGDRNGEARTLNNLGLLQSELGRYPQAQEHYQAAANLFERLNNQPDFGTALNNLGSILQTQGNFAGALEYYQRSLEIAQKVGDRAGEAVRLNNLGEIYRQQRQLDLALAYYQKALDLSREVKDLFTEATILGNLAAIYQTQRKFEQALPLQEQALKLRQQVGDRLGESQTLSALGNTYRLLDRPQAALNAFQQSVQISLEIRRTLRRENRQGFLETQRDQINRLIDFSIEQNQTALAYQWANLATVAELADYSRLINARVANPAAQRAIEAWQEQNQKLSNLREQLRTNFSLELSQQINALQGELNTQGEAIAQQFPAVAELFETTPTDIAQLQSNLPAGTVVLHPVLLFSTPDVLEAIALFVITKDQITVTKAAISSEEFTQLVSQYNRQLQTPSQVTWRATSRRLYDLLIRPVEAEINRLQPQQLSIIATDKLRYIPFETLYDQETRQFLIQKYPINNLTRLSQRNLSNPASAEISLLAFGNPRPEGRSNLPGAEAEVNSIAALIPGTELHLRQSATLDTFKNAAPKFSVLHIATHGCFVRGGCPDLGMSENTILFADQNLEIADAALLGLDKVNLVTLSACQTAVQPQNSGEEFVGIAYLFERAGARSVVASLWDVDDGATKQLMVSFYEGIQQGLTKAEALRQAKLNLGSRHPYYWSAFILIGDHR